MTDVFSNESLQFLTEVRMRNSREWYAENKKTYERVLLLPFQHMVRELSSTMRQIDSELAVMSTVTKAISRINRDIRFSRDKSLYRDVMWLTFVRRTKERNDQPAFFFEISPTAYRYGMGFFSASVKTMNLYREAIENKETEFLNIVTDIANDGIFVPEGDSYKRNQYSGNAEEVAAWYNRKNIYMVANRNNIEELFDFDSLQKRLSTGFKSLKEFYLFLLESVIPG